ncbi:MAG TPA: NADH-quinone oxidoreductase subunit M [Flavobacterium sp.]|nr:NADH-quinone oxidoreductase subunit M [Flavobacterium sp.]
MNVNFILITLLLGAIITYLSGNKQARNVATLFGVLSFGMTIYASSLFLNGTDVSFVSQWMSKPNVSYALHADGLSLLMLLLNTFLIPVIILTSIGNNHKNPRLLYALVLFMAFAMGGTFLAADGLAYYVFWELALLPIFAIGLLWGNDSWSERKKTMYKFFIYTFAGSLFMLIGIIYLYTKTDSFLLADFLQLNLTAKEQTYIFLAFFVAYAIKLPVFPFHTWQANTYEKSPAIGTMLLSGIMLKMGVYSILRWQIPLTGDISTTLQNTVIVLALIGVVYASFIALRETNIKRILAYSSMAHVGLIAAGAYTYNATGYQGVAIQMVAHGVVIVALFFLAEILYHRYGTYDIKEMGGIRSQAVRFSSYFLIFIFASVGLPGTFSFIGEFALLLSLSQYKIIYAIIGGTTIIFGAYYMLKMFQTAMLGPENSKTFKDVSGYEHLILLLLALVVLFFGLYPQPITDLLFATL